MSRSAAELQPLAKFRRWRNSCRAMPSRFDKLAFDTTQAARVAWYFGQKLLAARLSRPMPMPDGLRGRKMPYRRRILADLRSLLEQDWRNIEAGYYLPPPAPWTVRSPSCGAPSISSPISARSRRGGIAGRPETICRQRRHPAATSPLYYRRNFHFQTDGYLSAASAARYDHQVEVLFGGGAAAMRRQALVPLLARRSRYGGGAAPGPAALLDIACGTGQFSSEVKSNTAYTR